MKRDRAATTQRAPGQASEASGRGRRRRSCRTGIYYLYALFTAI